ncbi:UNKNOWN [Stylonychia lemnae]|uniref:Uncharacterized protein n=1 Tax=Stylonychia lemnae TaxID=5949 RepID=A0A078A2B4_STYLE|nr:UNKNOWN [Stylonychia lemnae]|eukprot:CDW75962.1 UNKNOWN [Stylonychia lemnae]
MITKNRTAKNIEEYISSRLSASIKSEHYFKHPWLDPLNTSHCNSEEYFKDLSYFIQLNANQCTIALLQSSFLRQHSLRATRIIISFYKYGIKKEKKLLSFPLKVKHFTSNSILDKIKNWAICYQYLVFSLEESSDSEYINIVDLQNKNMMIKIKGLEMQLPISLKKLKLSMLIKEISKLEKIRHLQKFMDYQ